MVIDGDRGEILGTEVTGQLKWPIWLSYVFQLCLKVEVSEWIFPESKKSWSCTSIYFFFDATAIYRDANRRKKVHRLVLIYRLISRQPPFCVFDDAFNLSVYHSNIFV